MSGKRVLFLCTGNYYRSRFAEELFNHICRERRLPHSCTSRALAIERGALFNFGPISRHAVSALQKRGVVVVGGSRRPQQACNADFQEADVIIALKEVEHRPYVESRFPDFAGRVRYWHVHDIDRATPAAAMGQIDKLVRQLVDEIEKI